MQPKIDANKSNVKNAKEKKDTKVLNDQQNIREILGKHPYKRWENILDGNK